MTCRHVRLFWLAIATGSLLMGCGGAQASSCVPERQPVWIDGKPPTQTELALHRVRSIIAHQEVVVEARVLDITDSDGVWNWSIFRLATLQITKSYKGGLSGEVQVLLPSPPQQEALGKGDNLLLFASRETQTEATTRSDRNKLSGPKWAANQTRFLNASAPCRTLVYNSQTHPEMFKAARDIFAGPPQAQLLVEVRMMAPGANFDNSDLGAPPLPHLNLQLMRLGPGIQKPVAVRITQAETRGYEMELLKLEPGTYSVASSAVAGTQVSCFLDLDMRSAEADCSSVTLAPHAAHRLSVIYVPSATVKLAFEPDVDESMPIEFEFVPVQATAKLDHTRYVSGVGGAAAMLYPGQYQLQLILPRPDKSRQVTKLLLNGKTSAEIRPGAQRLEVSGFPTSKLASTSFIQPTDGTGYSISPRLLTSNGTYRSAWMGCEGIKCTVKGLKGQYIEMQEYRTGAPAVSAMFKLGEPAVQLPLPPK